MFNSPSWAALIDVNLATGMVSAVSTARLTPYGLGNPATPTVEAVALHGRNIALCEAIYPTLHLLEVVMRNRIHDSFTAHFNSADWYDEPWIWAGHAALVAEARTDLAKRNKPDDPDRVVAELGFGFWCGMFHHSYEFGGGPWPALLSTVLPRVPKNHRTRADVSKRVEEARRIRNRVFHHEPVAKNLNDAQLLKIHQRLVEVVGWFSPEARLHLEHLCRFKAVFGDKLQPLPPANPAPGVIVPPAAPSAAP